MVLTKAKSSLQLSLCHDTADNALTSASFHPQTMAESWALDKKAIPSDPNAFVFRNGSRDGRWYLYFYDRESGGRHLRVLKDGNGTYPKPDLSGQDDAWMLGVATFIDLKAKADRGEAIRSISFAEMAQQFLAKEQKKISSIPLQGITAARYRLLANQMRWLRDYVGDDKKPIHKFRRSAFLNYETWRKERAIQIGKKIPVQTTILQEMSALKRAFEEVGVAHGFVTRESLPEIPRIKLPKDQKHRRDDFSDKEWLELEKSSRLWWSKGLQRTFDEQGQLLKDSSGKYITTVSVDGLSPRSAAQLIHRQLIYYAMRISMDSGIRPGSLRKIKWKHISENTAIPKAERKTWIIVEVPPENTKTARYYRISAPIARHLEALRDITRFKKPDDLLFVNQRTGQAFSERIWKDAFAEALVEARLADWADDDSNNQRRINIHSGKNLTWYSFRHTHISMRLKAGVPVPVIAANTDTSMKYIEDHYFHYRADEATDLLSKGRKTIKAAENHLHWIG